jgi:hypothetical protein
MASEPDPVAAKLAAMREHEQRATPGPWYSEPNTGAGRVWVQIGRRHFADADCEPLFNVRYLGTPATDEQRWREYVQREADAAFIVTARTAMPRLLAAVEAGLAAHPSQTTANGLLLCPNCTRDMGVFVSADRCLIRAAITRELLGEEGKPDGLETGP